MTTTPAELQQCGQCKGYFPLASSSPEAEDGLFSHNCSNEPKATRELTATPAWAKANTDAPEQRNTGGTGTAKKMASEKQVAFILKLQDEHVAVDAMGRKDPEGRTVAQVLDAADVDRPALARKMTSAKASAYIDDLMAMPKANPAPKVETSGTAVTEDEAAEFVRNLGRKVEVDDVTPGLHSFAATWAANWTGSFQFMEDMRDNAQKGKLSKGMAKGVLNCFRADVLRAAKSAPKTGEPDASLERGQLHVHDGRYYRVSVGQNSGYLYANEWVLDGGQRTVTNKDNGESRVVPSGSWEMAKGAIFKLSADTLATPEQAAEFGLAYAACGFCGHDLDVTRSITVGYGPKCAAKRGLPW